GGLSGFWDFGPLGTELKNNIKSVWWEAVGVNNVLKVDENSLSRLWPQVCQSFLILNRPNVSLKHKIKHFRLGKFFAAAVWTLLFL
ncbi:MAG TPA: hypothetical protein ENI09_00035, partial [candidate division WWE3 bacterium]|nr:hypothetical protein [candidate division WWE3 bacterium]